MICTVSLCIALGLMYGCAQTGQYTSKDLTILPCEQRANEFFFPLEFDEAGNYVYEDQAPAIEKALLHAQRVFVFVHGWNKSPKLAEKDYQDLICRFYTHSKHDSANAKKSIIIGVFWPSTDFPPLLNFWKMKNRADDLAVTGFQALMKLLAKPVIESNGYQDLVLIGHSFGGRIILEGITHYIAQLTPETQHFLSNLSGLQILLLTTASGEDILRPYRDVSRLRSSDFLALTREWDSEVFLQKMVTQYGREFTRGELLLDVPQIRLRWHPTLVELAGLTDLRIYNIQSIQDDANRYLYPLASFWETAKLFWETGILKCGIGACGIRQWPDRAIVKSAGSLETILDLALSNQWNVDASKVIFSHTDIYKGRIASLLWELIALPPPQYVLTAVPSFEASRDDVEANVALRHRIAMLYLNDFRQMGEVGLTAVKELSVLAFKVDEELQKENWVAAEKGIREIAKLRYIYPGWFVQYATGQIRKGLFFDISGVSVESYPLTQDYIHLLLAQVLNKQGKCDEAVQVVDLLRWWSRSYRAQEKTSLKELGDYKIRTMNCYDPTPLKQ